MVSRRLRFSFTSLYFLTCITVGRITSAQPSPIPATPTPATPAPPPPLLFSSRASFTSASSPSLRAAPASAPRFLYPRLPLLRRLLHLTQSANLFPTSVRGVLSPPAVLIRVLIGSALADGSRRRGDLAAGVLVGIGAGRRRRRLLPERSGGRCPRRVRPPGPRGRAPRGLPLVRLIRACPILILSSASVSVVRPPSAASSS